MNTTSLLAGVSIVAGLYFAAPHHAHANDRLSIEPFQSRHAWQVNWDNLIQRGSAAGAQWQCRDNGACNMYFLVKPGVKAHLATARYGDGYCYILEGAPTADCYRQDGKKTVWTVDKPFEYGLTPDYPAPQSPAPDIASAPVTTSAPTQSTNQDIVVLTGGDHGLHVQVQLSGHWQDMIIDTGASIMSVSPALADQLVNEGKARYTGDSTNVTMADGSAHPERIVMIDEVAIGRHSRFTVPATVSNGDALLPLPVLRALGGTLDMANNKLIFG
jgi:hypothetical protein